MADLVVVDLVVVVTVVAAGLAVVDLVVVDWVVVAKVAVGWAAVEMVAQLTRRSHQRTDHFRCTIAECRMSSCSSCYRTRGGTNTVHREMDRRRWIGSIRRHPCTVPTQCRSGMRRQQGRTYQPTTCFEVESSERSQHIL